MTTTAEKPWKLMEMNRHFPWAAERVRSSHATLEEAAVLLDGERSVVRLTVLGPDGKLLQPCDVDARKSTHKDGFMAFLVIDDPDGYGKQHFWGFWKGLVGRRGDEYGVRGQYFRAKLSEIAGGTFISGEPKRVEIYDVRKMGLTEADAMRRCEARVREVTGLKEGAVAC